MKTKLTIFLCFLNFVCLPRLVLLKVTFSINHSISEIGHIYTWINGILKTVCTYDILYNNKKYLVYNLSLTID